MVPGVFVPPSPSECPFLIHSALLDFTGYVRGRLDHSRYPPALDSGRIYSKPDPDDPLVLSNTEHLRIAAHYPIFVPNTENPQPLVYSVCAVFSIRGHSLEARRSHIYNSRYSSRLASDGRTLKLSKIKTVGVFLEAYFEKFQNLPKLRSLPDDDKPLKRFRVRVAKIIPSMYEDVNAREYIEIDFQDTKTDENDEAPSP